MTSMKKKKRGFPLVLLLASMSSVHCGLLGSLGGLADIGKSLLGGGGASEANVDYDAQRDTIVPGWSAGVVEKHDGTDVVCFDGICKESEGSAHKNKGMTPGSIFAPPKNLGRGGSRPYSDDDPYGNDDEGADSEENIQEKYNKPNAPFHPVYPNEGSHKATIGDTGGIPALPLSVLGGPASGFGDSRSKDNALGAVFSIGDEDKIAVLARMSLELPLKNFLSGVNLTSNEMNANDRREYLTDELEGKGSVLRLDTNLNVLASPKFFFYLPRTALSFAIASARLVFPKNFIDFMKKIGFNTKVLVAMKDADGSIVYYIHVYNSVLSLPNPQRPIVSQILVTLEGYGMSLVKAKRLEIEKALLILHPLAHSGKAVDNAVKVLEKFISGQISNPFKEMAKQYDFGESEEEETASSSSSSSERTKKKKSASASSSDESEESESSSSSSSESESYSKKAAETVDGLLAQAREWREKAASSKSERHRKHCLKKAAKCERKAEELQNESYNEQILSARSSSTTQESSSAQNSVSAAAAAFATRSGSVEVSNSSSSASSSMSSSSSSSGESWYSSSKKENVSVERLISSKKHTSSSHLSVYDLSNKESLDKTFTSNAASAILSSHQSNEMHYQSSTAMEYATNEIKETLMSIASMHSFFSSSGSMYKSQEYSSYGVRSEASSKKWLSKRVQKIVSMRKWMQSSSKKFMQSSGSTSSKVAQSATKEQAVAKAAISSYKKAASAKKQAAAYASMAKKASASGNTKAAKSYQKKANASKKAFSKHSGDAAKFAEAAKGFKAEKMEECSNQAAIFAEHIKNPDQHVTKHDLGNLQKSVAQILTSSQIQVLSKVLSPVQVRVLTKLLTPLQVQQTLVHLGAMTPQEIQAFLMKLQLKGLEFEGCDNDLSLPNMPSLLPSALQPLNPLSMCTLQSMAGEKPKEREITPVELEKYLLQGQLLFQVRERTLSPYQIELLKSRAVQQSFNLKTLIAQIEEQKKAFLAQAEKKAVDDNMNGTLGTCNPMLGFQTGRQAGALDGLSSPLGLQLGGEMSLSKNAFQAVQQILSSSNVAAYTGVNPALLYNLVYGQMDKNDLMCILGKALIDRPMYQGLPIDEKNLINARYNKAESKLYGVSGGSYPRLRQAMLSALNLVNNSSVNCKGSSMGQMSPQMQMQNGQANRCQILPYNI
ncbi:hypothetical protein NECID01_0180 [Nematocida sp. AWRm77]|nr:hypothetical protein NECID01_0180 [Nematocida sp. AWRm77]